MEGGGAHGRRLCAWGHPHIRNMPRCGADPDTPEGCLRYGLGLCPTSPYPYSLGETAQYSTSFGTPNRASNHIGYRHEGTFEWLGYLTHPQQSCLEKVTGPGGGDGPTPPHPRPLNRRIPPSGLYASPRHPPDTATATEPTSPPGGSELTSHRVLRFFPDKAYLTHTSAPGRAYCTG